MIVARLCLALLVLVAWPDVAHSRSCPAPRDLLIAPINIVDVEHGKVRKDRGLLLTGGRIAAEFDARQIKSLARRHPRARRIEAHGAFAIPGLWDMHVHTLWDAAVPEPFFRRFLFGGVTAIRDMGGDLSVAATVKQAVAKCRLLAPRLWAPGPFLDGPEPVDPALSLALSTPEQGREAVRALALQKVDFIKVYSLLSPNVLEAVVAEADSHGLTVVGHVPAVTGATGPALRLRSIEHLAIEVGGFCPADNRMRCGPIFQTLIEMRIALVPTLVVRDISTAIADPDFREPKDIESYPAVLKAYWREQRRLAAEKANPEWKAGRAVSLDHARWMTGELAGLGATLLAGSDAGNPYVEPGLSLHLELERMVAAGLTPRAALATATIAPARYMGLADSGVVASGMAADIVLLRANPLDSIANTRSISMVVRGGRIVDLPLSLVH